MELEFRNVDFEREGKLENPEKNPQRKGKNKLNPHMMPGPGIEPGTHWWVVSFAAVIRVITHRSSPLTAAHSSSAFLSSN